MSIEQRAHDLTMLYIETIYKYKQLDKNNNINRIEINILNDYLKYYPIVLEQLRESFND